MDVVGIGNIVIDFLINIAFLPGENQRTDILDCYWQGGGMAATALAALSRLGADTGMLGAVGGDRYGEFCLSDLEFFGVDTSHVLRDPAGTTAFSAVLSDNRTHGRNILHKAPRTESLELNEDNREYIAAAKYLHLCDTRPVSYAAARFAKSRGVRVVIDADRFDPCNLDLLPYIDAFIACEECYFRLFPDGGDFETNFRNIQAQGPEIVAATLGKKGVRVLASGGYFELPALPVTVRDTTGAGDVFHGAFIYGLLQDWDPLKTAEFAGAAAALKCTRIGGRAGIADLETTMRLMETGIVDEESMNRFSQAYISHTKRFFG